MTLRAVASSGASGITIGTTTITGGATTQILYNSAGVVSSDAGFTRSLTAGNGITIAAGTAAANTGRVLNMSQTWTDGTSSNIGIIGSFTIGTATGDIINLKGGASGTTEMFAVRYDGVTRAAGFATTSSQGYNSAVGAPYNLTSAFAIRTAPTLASGGCSSAAMVGNNGTASFTAGVGTSCSGSQPLVFTLPAAGRGWTCTARNETNGATSAPAQSGAVSTTAVTITNYSRTLGTAAAWTDADVVTVTCLGG